MVKNYFENSFFLLKTEESTKMELKYAPTVQLDKGLVRGIVQEVDDSEIYLYQGLRYGKYNFLNQIKFLSVLCHFANRATDALLSTTVTDRCRCSTSALFCLLQPLAYRAAYVSSKFDTIGSI